MDRRTFCSRLVASSTALGLGHVPAASAGNVEPARPHRGLAPTPSAGILRPPDVVTVFLEKDRQVRAESDDRRRLARRRIPGAHRSDVGPRGGQPLRPEIRRRPPAASVAREPRPREAVPRRPLGALLRRPRVARRGAEPADALVLPRPRRRAHRRIRRAHRRARLLLLDRRPRGHQPLGRRAQRRRRRAARRARPPGLRGRVPPGRGGRIAFRRGPRVLPRDVRPPADAGHAGVRHQRLVLPLRRQPP